MLCPTCSTDLERGTRLGVEVDHCPSCRGVWLDRGEIDKLISIAADADDREFSERHVRDDDFDDSDRIDREDSEMDFFGGDEGRERRRRRGREGARPSDRGGEVRPSRQESWWSRLLDWEQR